VRIDVQRLRTLTTGRLHTEHLWHCEDDIKAITGVSIPTHQIPDALDALVPYLQRHLADSRFWNQAYDPLHVGEMDVPEMDEQEEGLFLQRMKGETR
jgi:hypothetical protein